MPEGPEYYVMAEEIPALGRLRSWKVSRHIRDFIAPERLSIFETPLHFQKPFAYGKTLWFPFLAEERQGVLVSQLGMSGGWFLGDVCAHRGHAHLTLMFDGQRLRYSDPRRFGRMEIYFDCHIESVKRHIAQERQWGIDPLQPGVTEADVALFLGQVLTRSARPVKSALLDQSVIFGSGNYLASEILFAAGVHPQTPVRRLQPRQVLALARAVCGIMQQALALGGNSMDKGTYRRPDGRLGKMWTQLRVYGKQGEPCATCERSIERLVIAGRSTFYCKHCQKR